MAESLIGTEVHVCNCGPACKCGYWSQQESACPCHRPTTRRRILAEDLGGFYVSETGANAEACEDLGEEPLTASNGRPLQRFALQRNELGDAVSNVGGRTLATRATASATSGTILDVRWSLELTPGREGQATLVVGNQRIALKGDGRGNWMTHTLAGLWSDPARIAENLIKFHPDFSPLARRSPAVS